MEDEEADQTADEDPAAAAEAAGDLRDDPSNRIGNGEKLDPVEKEIDRREATAAPLLKAPPPSPEADEAAAAAMAADKTQAAPPKHHHQHLRSGSAKNMARHSVLERSLSSRMAEIAPPDPKRSRGTEVEEPEDGGGGGGKCASWKRRWCKCMVAFAGDCAALCCCPCTILHLLALVCIRLPLTLLYGGCSRLRSRWRWHWRQWRRWWRSWRQWNSKRRMSVTSSFSADIGEAVVAVAAALGGGGGGGEARHSQHHQRRPSFNAWPFGEPLVIDFPPYPGGFGDARHWGFFDSASDGSGGSPKKAHSLSSSTANPQSWEQQQQHQRHQQQQQQEQQQNDYSQDSG